MNIIISGFSSRAAVETAAAYDCKIYSFDYFGDQDLEKYTAEYFSIKNSPGSHYSIKVLFEMIKKFLIKNNRKKFYFIYTSSWDNYPELLAQLEVLDNLILLGNNSDTIFKLSGRDGLIDLFNVINKTAFRTPETIFDLDLIKEKYKENFSNHNKNYLLKPFKSGGGKEIELILSIKDYYKNERKIKNGNYYLEEYIDGKVYSAQFAADSSRARLLSITEQLNAVNSDNPFKYGGNILVKADQKIRKILQETAEILTRNYRLMGINGFDFIIKNDNLYFLELNPRFTAAVELLLPIYSKDLFEIYFKDNLDKDYLADFLDFDFKEYGKIIYYADSNLKIKKDLKHLNSKNLGDSTQVSKHSSFLIKDLPEIGEEFSKGDPVFTIILKEHNRRNFWDLKRKLSAEVEKYFNKEGHKEG